MDIVAQPENRFKTEGGHRLTRGLFYETAPDKATVLYTLKNEDHQGYPSLYRLYMECGDPYEHRFAQAYLDGWDHWEFLQKSTWFIPFITKWRVELEVKLKSQALAQIMKLSALNGKETFAANKFLLEWQRTKDTKGRPSKQQIKEAAEEHFSASRQINDDLKRLDLKVLNS